MKKPLQFIFASFFFLISHQAYAIALGQQLEPVQLNGELIIKDDQVQTNHAWDSESLKGKIRTIQHIAGRSSAKAMNAPFINAIKAEKFDNEKYQTTTIINLKDIAFGTGLFVKNKAKATKKEFYWSSLVLDEAGEAREAWKLEKHSSTIIILDQEGKVIFVKDGKMSKQEIKSAIATIKDHMQ
jgi:YtfJ family uncharacterized protein